MVACIAGMLLDEFDEFLPPGGDQCSETTFLQALSSRQRLSRLLDRLASILVDLLDIKVLGFHAGRLLPGLSDRPAKSACALKPESPQHTSGRWSIWRHRKWKKRPSNNNVGLIVTVAAEMSLSLGYGTISRDYGVCGDWG
jgi:hypothetical protein